MTTTSPHHDGPPTGPRGIASRDRRHTGRCDLYQSDIPDEPPEHEWPGRNQRHPGDLGEWLSRAFKVTYHILRSLHRKVDHLMNQDTALTAAVSRLSDAVTSEVEAITKALQPKADDPIVASAIARLNTLADTVNTETTTLGNAATASASGAGATGAVGNSGASAGASGSTAGTATSSGASAGGPTPGTTTGGPSDGSGAGAPASGTTGGAGGPIPV